MAINKIILWTNSLSSEVNIKPDVRIKNVGAKKQWITQANEKVAANLSVVNCVFTFIFFQL